MSDESRAKDIATGRRSVLLAGTALATIGALAAGSRRPGSPGAADASAGRRHQQAQHPRHLRRRHRRAARSAPTRMGMMGYRTPNIDRIAKEGAIFTDSYGQQSCTAGRASFILGQEPFRTGLLTIGMPGDPHGITDWMPTIADVLKTQGYATGQFGKNHLGDRDEHLPTNHGFDEFFGNLYHLNAEEEPEGLLLSEGSGVPEEVRPARRASSRSADGKIEDTGPLNTQAHGDGRRGVPRRAAKDFIDRQAQGRQAVLRAGSTPRACTSSPICKPEIAGQDRQGHSRRRHGRA